MSESPDDIWNIRSSQKVCAARYCSGGGLSGGCHTLFQVDPDNLDFSQGSDVVKLDLGVDMKRVLSGEVSPPFEPAKPSAFQPSD